ncbi:DNA cytosine methyltransferase [Natronorubrum halophilum]|uniref:DNA cytosine methyltransferase n=1 Tax=Natronorubrum halophilum TaxID=1702106 RepID=UPI0010C1D5A5|nr:DNA cytosine methyltransferase [Natronorubrum halophilum]
MTTDRWVVIDLFSGLGGFSAAFEESSEWDVFTVELNPEFDPDLCADVIELSPDDLLELVDLSRDEIDVFVVLASPPCTYFSTAGNHHAWDFETHTPITEEARNAVTLVYHTLGLIEALNPNYWFLENPQGRLRWFLDRPTGKVTYCQYGRPYMKRTDLWGSIRR